MTIRLLFFGITTDILGVSSLDFEISGNSSVQKLKNKLRTEYPKLKNINSYAIAVNESYAEDSLLLKKEDVVAIIPPVSGG